MQMTKKVLSIVLAVMMAVSMMAVMGVSVSAATTRSVATKTEFVDAVNNADAGDTIKITADFELDQVVTFDKKLTVDFNTHKITVNKNRAIVIDESVKPDNSSALTRYDWVTFKGTTGGLTTDGDVGFFTVKGYLKIEGGTYNAMNMTTDGLSVVNVHPGGTLNMDGGEINAKYYGVYVHGADSLVWIQGSAKIHSVDAAAISGNGLTANAGYTMTIGGGTLISDNKSAIYHPNSGNLTIAPGNSTATITIQGKTGIYAKAGYTKVLTATGKESKVQIIGTGAKAPYEYNGNGNNPTGDAIVIDNCDYPAGGPSVEIKGGTFTSNNAKAVASYVKQDDPAYSGDNQARVEKFINGGKFSTSIPEDYLVDGKMVSTDTNGVRTIVPAVNVARVNGTDYTSLQAAVDAAGNGDTVTLLSDCDAGNSTYVNIAEGKNVTIDFNGYTFTSKWGFENHGKLTLADTNGGGATATWTVVDNYGELVVNSGDYQTTGSGSYVVWNHRDCTPASGTTVNGGTLTNAGGDGWGVVVEGQGVNVTVNGGTIDGGSEGYGISGIGNSYNAGYSITVNGGTVTGGDLGIYHPNQGDLEINGGTVTGKTGVYVKSGNTNVTVTGGTIEGTGNAVAYNYNGNGANPTGDAFIVDNCNYPGGAPTVSIKGGTFKSTNAKAVASYTDKGTKETEPGTITGIVSGGNFSSDVSELVVAGLSAQNTGAAPGAPYSIAKSDLQTTADTDLGSVFNATFVDGNDTFSSVSGFNATLLGVQIRKPVAGKEYKEGYVDEAKDLRYIAAVDKNFLNTLDDYGFEIYVDNVCKRHMSCKDTTNNTVVVSDNDSVEYFTAALYGFIQSSKAKKYTVRFYIEKGGKTAYAQYAKAGAADTYGIFASFNDVLALVQS